jgi:DNA helicase-2/ATP-dependent DNA helicase PcrA
MRTERIQKQERTISIPKKVTPLQQVASSIPLSKEAENLYEGDVIEHERFGRGVVTSIEMSGNDRRAFVDFESAGKKQLLLKFAKFTIIGHNENNR